jgi:ankyrin repeat protein
LNQEFEVWSAQSKHTARELLYMLFHLGLDINYLDNQGFTPLQRAINAKVKRLVEIFMSRPECDTNKRCLNQQYLDETALHMAVRTRDYDMVKLLVEF